MSDDEGFGVTGSAAFAGEDSVALLTTAWLNEKMAPEILVFEAELVAAVQERLEAQLERLTEMRRLDSRQELIANIMQLEADRVRYVITSYFRTRLQKLEKHAVHILKHAADRISPAEEVFLNNYITLLSTKFEEAFVKEVSEKWWDLSEIDKVDGISMIDVPNLDTHVFLRVVSEVGPYELKNWARDQIDLRKDDVLMGRYSTFKSLLEDGLVELL